MSNSSKTTSWAWRFWAKVDTENGSGCWLWTGGRFTGEHGSGRGFFNAKGLKKNVMAHRVMYELVKGPIPEGVLVLHTCNRGGDGCVTPSHLYLGDHKTNARDRGEAGRTRNGHLPGYRAKLTWAQVQEIRARGLAGQSQAALGRKYGVSAHTIRRVLSGQTWQRAWAS